MPVKSFRPLTPSTRYITIASFSEITKSKPEKSLIYTRKKTGGRNSYGRVTSRGIGRGHKQKVRTVDFRRNKLGMDAKVVAIEYDPIRTARLALLEYKDGERAYIIAPVGLAVGATLRSGPDAAPDIGNALPLKIVPIGHSGRARHRGIRPLSRGVAKNPVDHPMGGGAGKTSGGGHPVTPWGVITKGFKTRKKFKQSNSMIVTRRNGRPMKKK